ncbi:MAG: molecular chaperone Hsp33 [Verrucomicrobiales bacterium]|jgi:molecular chaperone Hsp33
MSNVSESDSRSESNPVDEPSLIEVKSYFVRSRNALAVRAEFSQFFVDYYLHLMDSGLRNEDPADQLLKDALVGLTLHMTTRPIRETHAWTLNFQDPLLNIFVTGSSLSQNLVGRAFTEGIRESQTGVFHSQLSIPDTEPRNSVVEIKGSSVFEAIEDFYAQSEQRLARIFPCGDEEFIMVSAQPDCDSDWLAALDNESILELDSAEELSLLERRHFKFECGCSLERIFPALAPLARNGLDELFQGDQSIGVTCPRCAAKWRVTREQLEAVMKS